MADFGAVWDPAALGNYDTSRTTVNLIVDHHTATTLAAALGRFTTPGTQVSAHFTVDHDGTVYELVPIGDTAYDAGNYAVNQRSVGIEHVSIGPNGEVDYFTDAQYLASQQLHMHIAEHFGFPLDPDHVWPHSRVVQTECPGTLDLTRLIEGDPMDPQDITNLRDALNQLLDGNGQLRQWLYQSAVAAAKVPELEAKVDALTAAVAKLTPTTGKVSGTLTIGG